MVEKLAHYNPECRVSFDVDETLIKFGESGEYLVHERHVQALKQHWARGHHIRVHSAGGSKWAEFVVTYLNLERFVHEISAKDSWYYDDRIADDWMDRVYYFKKGWNNGSFIGTHEENRGNNETSASIPLSSPSDSDILHPVSSVESPVLILGDQAIED